MSRDGQAPVPRRGKAKVDTARAAVRLADVAARAGVGASIVSRVLNDDPTVSIRAETRERILRAARELDYRPHFLGRALRSARSTTLAMIVPNLTSAVNAAILRGAERAAAAAGYALVVCDADDFLEGGEASKRLLLGGRVDGLLIASGESTDPSGRLFRELQDARTPLVAVNRRIRGVRPYVCLDDARGMEVAVAHLAQLGHRRIAHIAGPKDTDTAQRRLRGFRSSMRAAGLPVRAAAVVRASVDERDGYEAMLRLLAGEPRPTAVAVWSLSAAVGALAAARQGNVRVPEQVSVVAFHDAPIAEYLEPSLTTVRMPLYELSATAVRVLLRLIEGAPAASAVVDAPAPALVARRSTASPVSP